MCIELWHPFEVYNSNKKVSKKIREKKFCLKKDKR